MITLTTLRTKIINAYAHKEAEKEVITTLGSMQYTGITYGARIDLLAGEFAKKINGVDFRVLLEALPRLKDAKLPGWVLRGEYTVDCDDKDWYLVECSNANHGQKLN